MSSIVCMEAIKVGAWPKCRGHLFSVIASYDRYCRPADGTFNSIGILACIVCPNFLVAVTRTVTKKLSEVIPREIKILHQLLDRHTAPIDWVAVTKFKINIESFL